MRRLLTLILLVVLFPGVFAFGKDPHEASLDRSLLPPSGEHWFGTDLQGYDIYARTIYGARASVLVGVLTTIAVVLIGGVVAAVSARSPEGAAPARGRVVHEGAGVGRDASSCMTRRAMNRL